MKNKRKPGTNVFAGGFYTYPVVAETYDGYLNDINGFHVKPDDVAAALDSAASGPVPEGNVGGGTGMVCYGFKGGIGTSSRKLTVAQGGYTVGALVQCNCGSRSQLRIGGLPVGQELAANPPVASVQPSLSGGHGVHHHRGSDGRAAAAAPDQAAGPPRHDGAGAHRLHLRQRIGRYLHCFLHG